MDLWAKQHNKNIHDQGRIVLGAPGIGKTTFASGNYDWVDADEIFKDLGVHTEEWHNVRHNLQEIKNHYTQCDELLNIMRNAGLWVIGSLFWEIRADAIVLINEDIHRTYVDKRDDLKWDQVQKVVRELISLANKHNIPTYSTIEQATGTHLRW